MDPRPNSAVTLQFHPRIPASRAGWAAALLCLGSLFAGCGDAPPVRPPLPPSASDLTLLKAGRLCDEEQPFLGKLPKGQAHTQAWGDAHEVRIPAERSETHSEESWFFDKEGVLVGALFFYPAGLSLDQYPVLRQTITELRPVLDFYLHVPKLPTKARMETTYMFQTGDEKTTTQYLVTGTNEHPVLLTASFAIDPYVPLLSPYRKEFLDRLRGADTGKTSQGAVDQEPFPALQNFARGEAALLAYCKPKNPDVAIEAYQAAIAAGISNKVRLAETHHKLGLAWQAKGNLEKAIANMEQSLTVRPNIPEVINNLGTAHLQQGERDRAIAHFERAISIKPNYPLARYNLAEAVELTNRKLAISEYETYLALAEGNPDETDRAARVKRLLKDLRR